MAVSVEAKIIDGLVSWFQGITLPAGVTVAYPNINFTPPAGLPHIALMVRKNTPTNAHIGGGTEPIRQGIFLANVNWPNGHGIIKPTELAAVIRDRFAFGTVIGHDGIEIRIVEEPTVQGDVQGDVYTVIPVVVPWNCYPS